MLKFYISVELVPERSEINCEGNDHVMLASIIWNVVKSLSKIMYSLSTILNTILLISLSHI